MLFQHFRERISKGNEDIFQNRFELRQKQLHHSSLIYHSNLMLLNKNDRPKTIFTYEWLFFHDWIGWNKLNGSSAHSAVSRRSFGCQSPLKRHFMHYCLFELWYSIQWVNIVKMSLIEWLFNTKHCSYPRTWTHYNQDCTLKMIDKLKIIKEWINDHSALILIEINPIQTMNPFIL